MKLKDFLRPTAGKIALFIILMASANYYVISTGLRPDIRYFQSLETRL